MATNRERQAKWREKAQKAIEFQRQHQQQSYEPPAGYVLVRMDDWQRLCEIEVRVMEALRSQESAQ